MLNFWLSLCNRDVARIPITDGGRLVGIFTERDVVTPVVSAGRDATNTPLGEVMTPDPAVLGPKDSVRAALDLINSRRFRHLPIVAGDRLLGIVSIRDLYRSVVDQMEADIILLAEGLLQG